MMSIRRNLTRGGVAARFVVSHAALQHGRTRGAMAALAPKLRVLAGRPVSLIAREAVLAPTATRASRAVLPSSNIGRDGGTSGAGAGTDDALHDETALARAQYRQWRLGGSLAAARQAPAVPAFANLFRAIAMANCSIANAPSSISPSAQPSTRLWQISLDVC